MNTSEELFSLPVQQPHGHVLPPSDAGAPLSGGGNRGEAFSNDDDGRSGFPSASSMPRLVNCPGSANAERGLPQLAYEEVTETGDKVHESLETGDDGDLEMTEREIKHNLQRLEQGAVADWVMDFGIDPADTKVVREVRFWIRNRQTLDPLASAKPDVVHHTDLHALGINYKSGFGNQTASELNWQCRTEAVAFWHEYPSVEQIRWGIAASRLTSKLDLTDYTREDLKRIETEIRHAIWKSEQPDAPRHPGSWCRWCKAQGQCREYASYCLIVQTYVPMSPGKPDQLAIIAAVHRMTPQEMAQVFKRKSAFETAFKAIQVRMLDLPEEELNAAGFAKAPGNKNYPIPDIPAAFDTLVGSGLLTEQERKFVIKITRGAVEELVAEKRGITKKESKQLVIDTLGLVEVEGGKKLKAI